MIPLVEKFLEIGAKKEKFDLKEYIKPEIF